MSRIPWGPLDDLSTLRESVDVLLEVPFACRWRGWALATGHPAVDFFETEHDLIVRTELSGIDPRDVEITVTDRILTIKSRSFRYRKPRQEAFMRSLTLPYAVNGDQIKVLMDMGSWKSECRKTNRRIRV
jgi:HSP20 family protein